MSAYRNTSERRYMWGIGLVCSIIFIAITESWATRGCVTFRFNSFGSESTWILRSDKDPVGFWSTVAIFSLIGVIGAFITARGLARTKRAEEKHEA